MPTPVETFWAWVVICIGFFEILLALWIFQKDWRSNIHRSFALVTLFLAIWTAVSAIEILIFGQANLKNWDRILFFTIYAASVALLHFSQVYPIQNVRRWLFLTSFIIFIIISALLFFTDSVITEPFQKDRANPQWLYPLYIMGFLFNWVTSIILLYRSRLTAPESIRRQIILLLIAIVVGSALGMLTSFVLPYFSESSPTISQLWSPGVAFIISLFSIKVLRIAFYESR